MSALLCVIPGPSVVLKEEPDERGLRWCFHCRRRGAHAWQLLSDPLPRNVDYIDWPELDGYAAASIVLPSYYEPNWVLRCPTCHEDRTAFPGTGLW